MGSYSSKVKAGLCPDARALRTGGGITATEGRPVSPRSFGVVSVVVVLEVVLEVVVGLAVFG
ncbi:MAG: hypothetical protein OK455_05525 [Thaumarchaeota archaeon]|nr:hypothetical protein [Nitrososphaerota archaeon]